jgi:phosphoribosylformimino-5-aminoimidazole carboxamide ribotide isomerase
VITIPAIDLMGGRVVRLVRGDPRRARAYSADPVGVAQEFAGAGARWLHVVDLDAALGTGSNRTTAEAICRAVDVPVQVGGGLRDGRAIADAFEAGAARVVLGTLPVEDRDAFTSLAATYGDRLVVALDVRGDLVSLDGWRREAAPIARTLPELSSAGAERFLITAVDADGTLGGPDVALYRYAATLSDRPVIASGGVRSPGDLLALAAAGVEAAVVGTAVYEGRVEVGAVVEVPA